MSKNKTDSKKASKPTKKAKGKVSIADKLEMNIRLAGLEAQITQLVNDIQNIELNAKWCDTEIGKAAQMEEHDYDEKELATVLEKQEANRKRKRAKADLLKDIYSGQLISNYAHKISK